ncbi:ABC transporter ATP-binding protein [Fusobacterium ulcerans]|jgi:peptide/nickel transport system ATP-binding protein|uniref:ABC transporter ATP-binding protein n=1 Tax=Fusobacterium ulcerans TaxID=861 RepID=UPI001D0ACEF9|nr:ABC transporter ATP-binding protein [Fusobacterium ulcerans]MCB8564310.1 ABC transporter ATP-binding protein [Fusobacterium ulcerans]MCB8648102.1 ABC transporter ATP-binding protein [Fusobacterium ulcerans]
MLKIKNLTIQYGNKEPVVKDFNLSIKKGEIIGIVGESGSGKTTIIKSIVGALSYNSKILSGSIILDNEELLDNNGEILKKNRGKNIAMIFQDCRNTLNPIRKIGSQYVEYIQYHSNCSKEEARKKAESMLAKMKLPDPENVMRSYPHQLSGGMCQRIGIAMAMTFNPKILLADEPTSALDVTTQAQIVQELINLRDTYETSIIIVTHNLGVASYMSDNIIVMRDGDVIEKGKPEQILSSPSSNYTKLLLNSVPGLEERYVV